MNYTVFIRQVLANVWGFYYKKNLIDCHSHHKGWNWYSYSVGKNPLSPSFGYESAIWGCRQKANMTWACVHQNITLSGHEIIRTLWQHRLKPAWEPNFRLHVLNTMFKGNWRRAREKEWKRLERTKIHPRRKLKASGILSNQAGAARGRRRVVLSGSPPVEEVGPASASCPQSVF